MLSILIPIFNFDCSNLIWSLHNQTSVMNIPFEILVYDDCSTEKQPINPSVLALENVKYKEMKTNLGRSIIRNILAKEALYENLLFLDCDSMPADNNFVKRYIAAAGEADCICGGTIYQNKSTIKHSQILHWTYGTQREMKAHSYSTPIFMANNFMIKSSVFLNICFNTDIQGYGHEDTLFGITLMQKGYTLSMIDNPVLHLGLNDTASCLKNMQNAVSNLRKLYDNQAYQKDILSIRLVKAYKKIHKIGLDKILCLLSKILLPVLRLQLNGSKPLMPILDFYKLILFCKKPTNN